MVNKVDPHGEVRAVFTLAALSIALVAGPAQQRPGIADAAAVLRCPFTQ